MEGYEIVSNGNWIIDWNGTE